MKKLTNHTIKYLQIGLFSLVLTIGTLFIPKTADNIQELSEMHFGFPFTFVIQDLTAYERPFPWTSGFSSPYQHPWAFFPKNFWLSYFSFFIVSLTIVLLGKKTNPNKVDKS